MILLNEEVSSLALASGLVEKYDPELINGCGIDVRAGALHFRESNEATEVHYDGGAGSITNRYAIDWNDKDDHIIVQPKALVIVFTQERFNVPNWLQGDYKVSASLAACGVSSINSATLRPGWSGNLTISLYNYNSYKSIRITKGSIIGHVQFTRLGAETRPYAGKFQNLGGPKTAS